MKEKENTNNNAGNNEGPTTRSGKVSVLCGVHSMTDLAIAGKTVAYVRKTLKNAMNIDDKASAIVGGKEVKEDYILADGDALEFVKTAGSKGE